jgi:hypothetical protein
MKVYSYMPVHFQIGQLNFYCLFYHLIDILIYQFQTKILKQNFKIKIIRSQANIFFIKFNKPINSLNTLLYKTDSVVFHKRFIWFNIFISEEIAYSKLVSVKLKYIHSKKSKYCPFF